MSGSGTFRIPITPDRTGNGNNWDSYDKIFGLAAERGVTILPILVGNFKSGLTLPTSGERVAWEDWAQKVVRRYGYNGVYWSTHPGVPVRPVIAWEMWNEPNNASINQGTITAAEYGAFLAWAGTAVQTASQSWGGKTTGVLFGGLLSWSGGTNYQTYLKNAYEVSGAAGAFTGLSFHPYALNTAEFPGKTHFEVFKNAVNGARTYLNSLGGGGKSLWLTEFGWPAAAEYSVEESGQATLLRQSFDWGKQNAANLDLHALIWFNYRDISGSIWQHRCGLRTELGAFRESWFTFLEETGVPRWPTITKNLYAVMMNRAGSGKTEVHILDASTNYSTFNLQLPTALSETTASQWQFSFGDYNHDGVPDLIGVLMNGTGSGKTEVHILDGATNYSTFLLHGVSGLDPTTSSQWQFTTGDYNRDGVPDLIGVLMNGTGSGKTEVHILNGATGYTGPTLLSVATGLGETSPSQWQFTAGDYNRDGVPDLIGVLMKGTGSGKTEVHIFNGATNYSFALLRTGTGLEETKPQQWQFSAADYNGDGIPDLMGVLMNGTGTGKTEAHILGGASNYTSFLLHTGTALGETTASQWQFAGAHVSGDWHPLATTEAATGVGTEAATLNGAVNPQGLSTTYHFEYGTTGSYGSSTPESGSIGAGTSNVTVNAAISGLSPGTTYHFRVVATNLEGTSYGQDKTFKTGSTGTAGQLGGMAVTEPFNASSSSLANFNSNWGALGWASGATPKGSDTTSGWRPVDAYPTVNGAFYSPTITDTGPGIAAVATMAVNPANVERHFSVWLDMPSPASGTRAGYELRFTMVSSGVYNVALSKWQSGAETVLASKSSYAFANGNSLAVLDQGGTVSAWTNTGSGFSQLLSASDATFSSGATGIQGAGNITRLTNFKTGALLTPVAGMDAALNSLPVNDAFATNENPLSGGGAWAALAWDNSTSGHNTGRVEGGWGPYDAYSTINGAYWQKASVADSGAGDAVAAKLAGNPTIASRYFSLWLNAPSPASARSGYELRFTETSSNVYEVALSKWQSGVKTALASKAGYSFPIGSQFALVARAGTVSAWTKTGSEYTQLLSAADSTFISGYTGVEGSGNITRLKDFRSGPLSPF